MGPRLRGGDGESELVVATPPLIEDFVGHHRGGDGGVEAVSAALHGDFHEEVAAGLVGCGECVEALVAHGQ